MLCKRILHFPCRGECLLANQLKAIGVDAFSVNFVSSTIFWCPIEFPSPAVFIEVTQGQRTFSFRSGLPSELLKNGKAFLLGYIGKIIVVVVDGLVINKAIDSNDGIYFFPQRSRKTKVCVEFLPRGAVNVTKKARTVFGNFGNYIN